MKKKSDLSQKEVITVNDKKVRATIEISNIKNKMLLDIEEFAVEMDKAKSAISSNQANILNSIRERLSTSCGVTHNTFTAGSKHAKQEDERPHENDFANNQAQISEMLSSLNITNLAELLQKLQSSEELVFGLYKTIQSKNAEVEVLDLENKRLEEDLQVQMQKLEGLQSHNSQVKQDIELNTSIIKKSIAKYEQDYSGHVEVLTSISENLMTLLRNVSK